MLFLFLFRAVELVELELVELVVLVVLGRVLARANRCPSSRRSAMMTADAGAPASTAADVPRRPTKRRRLRRQRRRWRTAARCNG